MQPAPDPPRLPAAYRFARSVAPLRAHADAILSASVVVGASVSVGSRVRHDGASMNAINRVSQLRGAAFALRRAATELERASAALVKVRLHGG